MRHMVTNWGFRHSCSQSLSCNFHPIHCHPKIKCMGTGYKFPGFLRSLLYATEYKNTFNPPPPPPSLSHKGNWSLEGMYSIVLYGPVVQDNM